MNHRLDKSHMINQNKFHYSWLNCWNLINLRGKCACFSRFGWTTLMIQSPVTVFHCNHVNFTKQGSCSPLALIYVSITFYLLRVYTFHIILILPHILILEWLSLCGFLSATVVNASPLELASAAGGRRWVCVLFLLCFHDNNEAKSHTRERGRFKKTVVEHGADCYWLVLLSIHDNDL